MLIAHRGIHNSVVKENSIPAFLNAINDVNYSGFELDIYMSRDKKFIVYHDPLIDGRYVSSYSYKELKKKGVVKLEDVLKINTDKLILIDIKDIYIDADRLTKLLNKYKDKNIYVMSFFNSVIKKFKGNLFKIGILNYVINSTKVYKYDFMGILYNVASDSLIDRLKEHGIEVFIYGIGKKDKLKYKDVYYIVDARGDIY